MLFLMNDTVIDIGDPENTLIDTVGVVGLRYDTLKAKDIVQMAQQVWFKARRHEPGLDVQKAIAALVALKIEADAALIVVPLGARGPEDVQTRFASAPIPLMARMYAMQGAGSLSARVVSESVWQAAASSR